MNVVEIKAVEGCLEGTNVCDYYFDDVITFDYIHKFRDYGKLIYRGDMARPYFKLIVHGKYTIKGAEGKDLVRTIFPDDIGDKYVEEVKNLLCI